MKQELPDSGRVIGHANKKRYVMSLPVTSPAPKVGMNEEYVFVEVCFGVASI